MRHRERGQGRASFMITLALFIVGLYVAVKIVPVRIDGYQFREVLRNEARHAAVHRDDSAVLQRIMDSASAMNIPLDRKNLAIKRSTVEVIITAAYERSVDLKLGTYTYRFRAEQKAPLF